MKVAKNWSDFEVIASGDGMKLERWGAVFLKRPDPQAIWSIDFNKIPEQKQVHAEYARDQSGGGKWVDKKKMPEEWQVSYNDLKFLVKPMGFKHTGLFPEQAINWDFIRRLIKDRKDVKVLNLFGYSGAASVAAAKEGAHVVHVDASKGMVDRCKQNMKLNKLEGASVRYIVDDCEKFIEREERRGNQYDVIIMDPPSYGRGPSGEIWKLEVKLFEFVKKCAKILSDKPVAVLINSYTTGLSAGAIANVLRLATKDLKGEVVADEIGLPQNDGLILPCGSSSWWVAVAKNIKEWK